MSLKKWKKKSSLLPDFLIKVLEIYSLGLSIIPKPKLQMTESSLDMFEEKSDEELLTEKAEELGVTLEYYIMEFT